MDDVDVVTQQASGFESLPAVRRFGRTAALVHRGDEIEFTREGEVRERDIQRRVVWPKDRQAQRHQAFFRRQPMLQQALDFLTRMRHFPKRLLPRLRVGLRAAVKKSCANAGLDQAIDACIGVRRGRIIVAPINQRGGAAVDLVERPHQIRDAYVFRFEHCRQTRVHMLEVFKQRPVGSDATQAGLPGVHVCVDQAGDHNLAARVNHFCVGCGRC